MIEVNNNQFLEEIHHYIDDAYHEFERYQDIAFNIICEFDSICRRNDIQYFLAYGTLLGAVRDGGQIPWDYDIDVMVKIHDREKLIEVLKKELGPDYYYAYLDNTPRYPAYCLRVCKKGHHFNAIHVDVFFLIGCPNEENERIDFLKKRKKYCKRRLAKNSYYWFTTRNSGLENLLYYYAYVCGHLMPKWILDREEYQITNSFPLNSARYCCSLAREMIAFKTEWFDSSEDVLIKGRRLPIPIGYKEILKCLFESFSDYLPVSERFDEFYKFLYIIKKRDC